MSENFILSADGLSLVTHTLRVLRQGVHPFQIAVPSSI